MSLQPPHPLTWLRDELLIRLYAPTPQSARLADLLQPGSPLDETLTGLVWLVGEEFFRNLFSTVFQQIVLVVERVLLEEKGMTTRTFQSDDAVLFKEDIRLLCEYFVQRDDNGVAQGINDNDAQEWTKRLMQLVTMILAQPSRELVEQYNDSQTPETHHKRVVTRQVIHKVLMRRKDAEAKKFQSQFKTGIRATLNALPGLKE